MRLGPGTNYPKVSTLYPGYCLMYHRVILLSGGYYWMKVVYNGQNAWVASNWVSVTPCEVVFVCFCVFITQDIEYTPNIAHYVRT